MSEYILALARGVAQVKEQLDQWLVMCVASIVISAVGGHNEEWLKT